MKRMEWEPVDKYRTMWRGTTLTFSFWDKGTSPVIVTESDTTHVVLLDNDVRLCRLVETDAGCVPVEVREAIALMKTVLAIDIAAGAYTYLEIGPQLKEAVGKVGTWLGTLPQDGEP